LKKNNNTIYKCKKCNITFSRRDNLLRHLVDVDGIPRKKALEMLPKPMIGGRKPNPNSKKKALEDFVGKDGNRKPIRLNRVYLEPNNKEYTELALIGDIHFGHPGCDIEKVKEDIQYCVDNHIYVIGMGDYLEVGLRNSVGDSVYMQEFNPQEQMEFIVEILQPLADAGLLIGLHIGNHEGRILKETSVNIVSWMARALKVKYLGYACWSLLYVGNQSYTLYSLHGSTGSKHVYTKLKALVDISHSFDADITAMGHVHELAEEAILIQKIDKSRKIVIELKKYLVLTGSYLRYDDSYAQEKGYPMCKLGSPIIKLFNENHDIHIST